MRIEMHRDGGNSIRCPKPVWGRHAGKIWSAVTADSGMQSVQTGLPVYGMVLSSTACYAHRYATFPVGNCTRYLNVNDAILADFESHMVFAPDAVWLWVVIGAIVEDCLVPKAEWFSVLPLVHQIAACSQDWRITATAMCQALCDAVARDEYAREAVC